VRVHMNIDGFYRLHYLFKIEMKRPLLDQVIRGIPPIPPQCLSLAAASDEATHMMRTRF
jgi:hypothetical protein